MTKAKPKKPPKKKQPKKRPLRGTGIATDNKSDWLKAHPDAVLTDSGKAQPIPPPRPPGGRPTKLTPEISEQIIAAVRAGSYLEEAAGAVGVAQSTLHLWLQKGREGLDGLHTEFSEAVERARAEDSVNDLRLITEAAGRPLGDLDWRAAAWKRERKDPSRWGVKVRVTVTEELEGFLDDLQRVLPAEWYEKALEVAAARLGGSETGAPTLVTTTEA